MTRKLRVNREALRDQERLFDFLDQVAPAAAVRASRVIVEGLRTIVAFPHIGREADGGVREHVVRFGRSGYVIQYRVSDDEILIARIFHAREDR